MDLLLRQRFCIEEPVDLDNFNADEVMQLASKVLLRNNYGIVKKTDTVILFTGPRERVARHEAMHYMEDAKFKLIVGDSEARVQLTHYIGYGFFIFPLVVAIGPCLSGNFISLLFGVPFLLIGIYQTKIVQREARRILSDFLS